MKFQDVSIRLKLMLAVGLLLTIAIGGIVAGGLALMYSTAGAEAEARARSMLAGYAAEAVDSINGSIAVTSAVRSAVEGALKTQPVSRDQLGEIVKAAVAAHPEFVGMTLAFEPNAVDGNDAAAIGHQYSDATGRYVPYFTNSPSGVNMELLDMRPEAGTGEWYDKPIKENRDLLTPPYIYPIAGKDVLMSTTSTVIRRDGKPIGIVTADISLMMVADVMSKIRPLGVGSVEMISHDNHWIASRDPALIGQPLAKEIAQGLLNPKLQTEGQVFVDPSGVTQFAVTAPLKFRGVDEVWTMAMLIPRDALYANVDQMRNMGILAGIALLVVSLVLVWFGSSVISKPISSMTALMGRIAKGEFNVDVPNVAARDEMGGMARAVEVFRENASRISQMTEDEKRASDQRRAERLDMMRSLQQAFGDVVSAALAGDFSRRIETRFADAELNALAARINDLISLMDGSIADTGRVLAALARLDLTQRMEGSYQGALEQLKNDTNAVAEELTRAVSSLKETSRSLRTATGEILSGANDLSERTTKQAATIEETSATMDQLAATVLENAKRAEVASTNAADVSRTAEEGGAVMQRATEAMERLTQSSGKISNIIGLIDDIAFQTNLLALNASVEAARAGEAGKGFAVVAVEVRRLAQSAAEASSEVKALIDQSGVEVSGGSRLVAEAAHKLEAMLDGARRNQDLLQGIARESREQANSIEEVNAAVRQLDEMTQHNAALVEETNAAIEQTESQAAHLDQVVANFTLAESAAMAAEARRAAPAARTASAAAKPQAGRSIKALQDKVKSAAKTYLARGNAAVKEDWNEF